MKTYKIINISSNGSLYICYCTEASLNNNLINIQKYDDKNFNLNKKKSSQFLESQQSSYYKKKYLNNF